MARIGVCDKPERSQRGASRAVAKAVADQTEEVGAMMPWIAANKLVDKEKNLGR
ncbi:MAG: hypothetical protein ACREC9_07950 [Methylocella sp.]